MLFSHLTTRWPGRVPYGLNAGVFSSLGNLPGTLAFDESIAIAVLKYERTHPLGDNGFSFDVEVGLVISIFIPGDL